jgi:hypothetical protein
MRQLFEFLQGFGVPTLTRSRIAAYKSAFDQYEAAALHPRAVGNIQDLTRIMQSAVEFDQLSIIVRAARASVHVAVWRQRLQELFSGAAFPLEHGSHDSPARDSQFECLLAAVMELGGYGVSFEEPDVQVTSAEAAFGLAAKRPRRLASVRKNSRKAARQIRDSGRAGLVVLELSAALYPDGCINTNDELGAVALLREATNRFFMTNAVQLFQFCAERAVFGVVVVLHLPVLLHREGYAAGLTTSTRWGIMPLCQPGDTRLNWVGEFMNRSELGLFGPREAWHTPPASTA